MAHCGVMAAIKPIIINAIKTVMPLDLSFDKIICNPFSNEQQLPYDTLYHRKQSMSTIFVILWIITPLPYLGCNSFLKLTPMDGSRVPRKSAMVAPISAKVERVPRFTPFDTESPNTTIGIYSLVWSHPE